MSHRIVCFIWQQNVLSSWMNCEMVDKYTTHNWLSYNNSCHFHSVGFPALDKLIVSGCIAAFSILTWFFVLYSIKYITFRALHVCLSVRVCDVWLEYSCRFRISCCFPIERIAHAADHSFTRLMAYIHACLPMAAARTNTMPLTHNIHMTATHKWSKKCVLSARV